MRAVGASGTFVMTLLEKLGAELGGPPPPPDWDAFLAAVGPAYGRVAGA